jgi:hypothetical protein
LSTVEINQSIIEGLTHLDLDFAMFFVNTFFVIVSLQITHLFYVLWEEKRYERKNTSQW